MSLFEDRLNEYLGAATDTTDIRAVVRRCWFYDFLDFPLRLWDGKGRLFTEDGSEWYGTVNNRDENVHRTPGLADGRDGTAPSYEFTFGYLDAETYEALKTEQHRVNGRTLTCYLALFENGEGLRPGTPIDFLKSVTMESSKFDERLAVEGSSVVRRYSITILAKDGNSGRSAIPGRSYADTHQKRYARELGVELDRGAEFLAGLANRTYKKP